LDQRAEKAFHQYSKPFKATTLQPFIQSHMCFLHLWKGLESISQCLQDCTSALRALGSNFVDLGVTAGHVLQEHWGKVHEESCQGVAVLRSTDVEERAEDMLQEGSESWKCTVILHLWL
jgi:hypothetical protein